MVLRTRPSAVGMHSYVDVDDAQVAQVTPAD